MTAATAIPQSDARLRPPSGGASSRRRRRDRRADRGGRPERRRQVDAVQGHRRRDQAARRPDRAQRRRAAGHRLSAADRRDRPQLSDQRLRHGGDGPVAQQRPVRRHRRAASATRSSTRSRRSASPASRIAPIGTLSGGQMQRMLFARLLLQDARVIVLDEPFNAIDAKTSRRSVRSGAALARRAAHRAGGAARSRSGARRIFPRRCCSRASRWPGATTADVLTPENLLEGAPHVRGLRRAGRSLRGSGGRV